MKYLNKNSLLKLLNWKNRFIIALITCVISIQFTPVFANIPHYSPAKSQIPSSILASQISEGKKLYEAGQFVEAIQVLNQAVREYKNQGKRLEQAAALSNLSLAYQRIGDWEKAEDAINQSLNLQDFKKPVLSTTPNSSLIAQTLDIQGHLQLLTGKAELALSTWKQTEEIYTKLSNKNSIALSRLSQAQALHSQGFNRKAIEKLEQVNQTLQSQSDSIEKIAVLLSLGQNLQSSGELEKSYLALQQGLEIAQRLNSPNYTSLILLSFGNNARSQEKHIEAINFYQKAIQISPLPLTKIQAQLNTLSLLIETKKTSEAQKLIPQIQSQLEQIPPSRASIYARINFAQSLMNQSVKWETEKQYSPILLTQLTTAVKQARNLGDTQSESYALGKLANLYEQNQQIPEALKLTQQALFLAQINNVSEIAYLWQWQLGRLLKRQGDNRGAIAAYDAAVETLQSLRTDLVAVNQNVQFNFRDNVEPVYRESVALMLQNSEKPDEKTLDKARTRIEALQLAELDNFFKEACLQGQKVLLDRVVDKENSTAAIIYPIILPNQLQLIVKIPKQPLRHYTVNKSKLEVERILGEFREYLLEPDRTEEMQALSQEIYSWLMAEIEPDLKKSAVNTLVFVPDGAFRNIPFAALFDGKQYLVEKYAIALSLGLQLLTPKPLRQEPIRVLAAGLVQPPAGYQAFPPLPGIESEFNLIAKTGVSTKKLLNKDFTKIILEKNVNSAPFNILHLATHGQFSSRPENTFILATDGPINVLQFDGLLRRQGEIRTQTLEMLVLSACQTAAGDNRATLGLAGTSIKAGARSTIASLWHISDKSTAILIGEFYRELVTGKVTKAEALRLAQLKILKDYPNYSRPGFWAPYVLVGNWL
ncbi:MAG: CHAT domain-containing protein [Calothrix sp. CSU_2_0]|nr:CHAT domain-containing protein [Calothrix sp. CSU_2_0]